MMRMVSAPLVYRYSHCKWKINPRPKQKQARLRAYFKSFSAQVHKCLVFCLLLGNKSRIHPFTQLFTCLEMGHALCRYMDLDRKSTRLNSSHVAISYAVFCLKKK